MRISITGGIGSGKTTVCKYFENKGYFVFYSDIEAKLLANTNIGIKEQITNLFGKESYINDTYNLEFIRSIVFNDTLKLKELNKCFDGVVIQEFINKSLNHKISFFESALIFEHNLQDNFDLIIGVYCNEAKIFERLKQRNGFDEKQVSKIINNQLNTKEKMNKCNIVINTTNGVDYTKLDLILNGFEKTEVRGQKIFNYGLFSDNHD